MVRHWMLLCLVTFAAVEGCSWLLDDNSAVPIFTETPFVSGKDDDAKIITELYDFTERLRGLDEAGLREEYQSLADKISPELECKEPETCLKLAWLLSSVNSGLADYDQAMFFLNKTLAASSSESLLSDYIYEWRHSVEHNKKLDEQVKGMRYKMLTERRENKLLREKIEVLNTEIKTLEMKIEALTSIEQSLKNREQRQ